MFVLHAKHKKFHLDKKKIIIIKLDNTLLWKICLVLSILYFKWFSFNNINILLCFQVLDSLYVLCPVLTSQSVGCLALREGLKECSFSYQISVRKYFENYNCGGTRGGGLSCLLSVSSYVRGLSAVILINSMQAVQMKADLAFCARVGCNCS